MQNDKRDMLLLAIAVAGTCAWGGTPAMAWSAMGAAVCFLFASTLPKGPMGWWPIAFLLYACVLSVWSEVPARSAYFISQWIAWFAAFLLAGNFAGSRFRSGWIAFAVVQSAYGLIQYLAEHDYMLWLPKVKYLGMATGTYINHNHYAGLLEMSLPLTLQAAATRALARDGKAPLFFLAAVVELLAIVFSGSRAGLLCAALGIAVFGAFLVVRTRDRRTTALLASALLATVLYGAWIGFGPVKSRFDFFAESGYLQREGRLVIWRDTVELIRSRPWTGWGPGTFPSVYPLVRTESSDLRWMEAHNDYLQFAAELGIPGALLFFAPLFRITARLGNRAWRAPGSTGMAGAAMVASLVSILAHCVVEFHLYVPANAVWIMILAGMAVREHLAVWVEVGSSPATAAVGRR